MAIDNFTHRFDEPYEKCIKRVASDEIARRVKVVDVKENLANNRRLPSTAINAESIRHYELALQMLNGRP